MAKIALIEGFSLIPEGTHIFKITEVIYKEEFGKLDVKMETAKGQTHTERFYLLKKDGAVNEGAYNAFSFFAKTALQDYTLTEIDHNDLVGRYIQCSVEHDVQPSKRDSDKTVTFIHLGDKSPADGFNDEDVRTPVSKKSGGFDLDSLLG